MTPTIYHLAGPPASGKRTVGLALSTLTGAALLDNHLFNDAVFKPYGADGWRPVSDEVRALATEVWALGLRAAALAPADVDQIFTAYYTNDPRGAEAAARIPALARTRRAQYVPVWLSCAPTELSRRVTQPERQVRAKMRDPARLTALLTGGGLLPPPPGALQLDTTALSPDEAAQRIIRFAQSSRQGA
ncbi:hypothetical protein [Deinococcus aquaedulcis]|uniref:hypothetical protein n=1 Tax=Deinococcus aquaedulcis TaxID=2840455 RepID=UPI001F171C25|nr:hypothetical protein [Deinococcus aquaedulcis]